LVLHSISPPSFAAGDEGRGGILKLNISVRGQKTLFREIIKLAELSARRRYEQPIE
jgi:hypothetical protein